MVRKKVVEKERKIGGDGLMGIIECIIKGVDDGNMTCVDNDKLNQFNKLINILLNIFIVNFRI